MPLGRQTPTESDGLWGGLNNYRNITNPLVFKVPLGTRYNNL